MRTTLRLHLASELASALASNRAFALALVVAVAGGVIAREPVHAQGGPRERTMYVSAVDQKGEPVAGLEPPDFLIREDGALREILRVTPAIDPIDIAILVDNGAASQGVLPRVREGLTAFVGAMSKGNQIALIGLADRPTILVDYSQSMPRLLAGIGLLWPRSQAGTTLMDAIYEVSRGLEKRDTPRAIMVLVITDGGDFANRQYKQVTDEVKQAGVAIHAITVGNFRASGDDEMRNRARLLSEGTTQSGGQRVSLLTPTAVQQALERLARELSAQYKVVYGHPESLIPPEKTDVRARRPGVTMRGAPGRGTGSTK